MSNADQVEVNEMEANQMKDGGQPQAVLSPQHIMQVGMGFWPAKTLLSAVELGLFTELCENGPQSADQLRESLGLHERSALDFFDALVALGFLVRTDGVYDASAETAFFLDRNKPSYVGGILEMANHRLYGFWGSLTEGLRTGRPQNEAKDGGDLFDKLYEDQDRLTEFLASMTGVSRGANMAIARNFDWGDHKTVADIGAAQGDLAVQVAMANDHVEAIGFDLPVVQPIFEEYVDQHGLSERVSFVGGDFWEDDLPRADVITMGHILHDWGLEQKKVLIEKAYDALPDGGALIVYESIIDDDRRENVFGLLMSLNMLIETEGGFDFTAADCIGWMKDVGFKECRVEHLVGPDSMVIAIK